MTGGPANLPVLSPGPTPPGRPWIRIPVAIKLTMKIKPCKPEVLGLTVGV